METDNDIPSPKDQELLVEMVKLRLKINKEIEPLQNLVKDELNGLYIDLFMVERSLLKTLIDKILYGIPFGARSQWLKNNRPKIYEKRFLHNKEDVK